MAEEHQHLVPPAYIVTMESQQEDKKDAESSLLRHRYVESRRRCLDQCGACHEAIAGFYAKFDFPVHIVLSIVAAYLYPPLGAVYLHPDVTASIAAVLLVFVIVGLGLRTSDLADACCRRVAFNAFVQIYNFFFASTLAVALCRTLTNLQLLNEALSTGIMVCSCLPIAINALIVLTASAGGDEAVAVFNTVVSNMIGIFLSPVLIVAYLGSSTASEATVAAAVTAAGQPTQLEEIANNNSNPLLNVRAVFSSLFWIVVSPMLLGWFLHNYVEAANRVYVRHKRKFKKAQESCLVFIVYCTFCRKWLATPADGDGSGSDAATAVGVSEVAFMILVEATLMATLMGVAWLSLGALFPQEPELRVTGLFACHHKTIALGVPLIGSLYKGHPDLALYTLPILVWHPLQLVVGSMLVPALHSYIRRERAQLIATSSLSSHPIRNSSSKTVDDDDDDGSVEERGGDNATDVSSESTGGLRPDDASSRSGTPPPPAGGIKSTYGSIQVIDV